MKKTQARATAAAGIAIALLCLSTICQSTAAFGDAVTPAQAAVNTLTVNSQDSFGNTITGFYTELYYTNGGEQDAFTPHTFVLVNNETYTVHVENYGMYRFSHWLDTGSPAAKREIAITADKQIMAVYDTIPTHPVNLTAIAVSPNQVNLSWFAPAHNGSMPVTGYKVQRSTDDRLWTTITKNIGSTGTSYSDTGLGSDTTYYYRVFAISHAGTSYRSNIADVMTPLPSVAVNDTSVGPIVIVQPTLGR